MALPTSFNKVPVHIKILGLDGAPAQGSVSFTAPAPVRNVPDKTIIGPKKLTALLDAGGEATISLPSTNDPDNMPIGWTYTVTVATDVWSATITGFEVPYTTALIEFDTLVPLAAAQSSSGSVFIRAAGYPVSAYTTTGQTNYLSAVQAAINAAAPVGGWVLIDGDYLINGTVTVPSGARIDGSTGSLTQAADLAVTFSILNAPDVILRNVTAIGKGTDYTPSSAVLNAAAVYIGGTSTNVLIEGCTLRNHAGVGVSIAGGVQDVRIVGTRIQGPGAAEITPLADNYGMGVLASDDSNAWSVIDCDISEYAQGINSGENCSNIRISGNHIHNMTGQHGIYLDAVNNLIISDNIIRDTGLQGIKVQLANTAIGPDTDHVTITGNVVTNVGSHGLLLTKAVTGGRQTRRVTISGNTFTTNLTGGDGINLINVIGAVVNANVVHNARHGINANACDGLTVSNNRFHALQQNGLLFTATNDVEVVYNRVIDCGSEGNASAEFGIQVHTTSTGYRIVGNTISDSAGNMRYGLYLSGTAHNTIAVRNNEFTGATDYGARLDAAQAVKEWNNNVCQGALGDIFTFPSTLVVGGPPAQATGIAPPTTGTWVRGSIVWNRTPTAGGTLGWICTTAGTPGTWASFGKSGSASWNSPATNSLVAANYDPIFANITMPALTAGVLFLARIDIPAGGVITAVDALLGGAGTGLTTGQNFVGIYAYAAGGTLLAQSADQSTAWASAGQKSAAMTVPTASLDPGSSIYVAILFNGTGSPLLRGLAATASFVNVRVASLPRFATAGTTLTALPATLPAITAATTTPWVGCV